MCLHNSVSAETEPIIIILSYGILKTTFQDEQSSRKDTDENITQKETLLWL